MNNPDSEIKTYSSLYNIISQSLSLLKGCSSYFMYHTPFTYTIGTTISSVVLSPYDNAR
jgi:hypothetical protein